MNILITGNLSYLAQSLAATYSDGGHKVIMASRQLQDNLSLKRKIKIHPINAEDELFKNTLSAYNFDIILYLPTHEEHLLSSGKLRNGTGHLLSGLKNALELGKEEKIQQFIYLSSTEVYGNLTTDTEATQPVPESLSGYSLYAGEQYCEYFEKQNDLKVNIIRVPFLYGPGETTSYLNHLITKCVQEEEIFLPQQQSQLFNFLHVEDAVQFINQVTQDLLPADQFVINLSATNSLTSDDLSNLLLKAFPSSKISYDENLTLFTRPVRLETAKTTYDWVDLHNIHNDIEELATLAAETISKDESIQPQKKTRGIQTAIKWLELLLGAVVMQLLTQYSGTLIQFKYVDFRLLFVVLMSSVYGLRFGILSATLASLSILYTWYELGFNWTLISNNVGNWFPFVIYFATGMLLGYYRDKHSVEMEYQEKQTRLIHEKFHFLFNVFTEISSLKDEFREKLVGYRDSFGKIFAITQELDSLDENMIFLNALIILQRLLDNNSIAIYSIGKNQNFARLEASSPNMPRKLSKSLDLTNLPEIKNHLQKGQIYHNAALKPEYPAYISPIMNQNQPAAIVTIWDASFEQHSLYYYNLFKVITGLIQAALVRASLFENANIDSLYHPKTRILKPEAFQDALKIKIQMKKNQVSDHQILKINSNGHSFVTLFENLADKIRTDDLIGSDHDGNCYLVLSQADEESINDIVTRFGSLKEKYQLIQDKNFNFSG